MNNNLLLISIVILFILTPLLGLYYVIMSIIRSKKFGNELDNVAEGINNNLDLLQKVDIAQFDGLFSNWLETQIKLVQSDWVRASLRLAIVAKTICLGESHRELLNENEAYRKKTLTYCRALTKSYERGDPFQVYNNIANLFSLFYASQNNNENYKIDGIDPKLIVINTLNDSSNALHSNIMEADILLSKALKNLSSMCNTMDSGMPFLILQWASIKVKEKNKVKSGKIFQLSSKNEYLSGLFSRLAELYNIGDYTGVVNVISGNSR